MKPQSLCIIMDHLIIKYQFSIIRYFAIMVPPVVQGFNYITFLKKAQ